MGALFVFMLKSSVCVALFYLFYRLLLSRDTFHHSNRFVLLGLLLFSFLIPCLEITVEQPIEIQQKVMKWETVFAPEQIVSPSTDRVSTVSTEVSAASWNWQAIVLVIYLSGILFFLIRNIYSLVRMAILLCKSKFQKLDERVTLVIHKCKIAPFSCMKYMVISASDLQEGGEEIILHEREHIRSYHSLDLLVAELTILFQWFNPAAWLFRQELQNVHEYEADQAVIHKGIDAKQYQLLLIKKAIGTVCFNSLVNSFNHSTLKKRIFMMLKRKSNPWNRLKYLGILPLAAMIVTVFARPTVSGELNRISQLEVNDLISVAGKESSKDLLHEEMNTLTEVENENQPELLDAESDTVFLRDTVYVTRNDTLPLPVQVRKKTAVDSGQVARMKDFLNCHPYAWIVVNQKEMRAYEVDPEEIAEEKGTIIYYPLDMSKRYGKRAAGGVMLVNTDEEYFKNVIVRNRSYEALLKAAKNKFIMLDGEAVFFDSFKLVDPCTIRSVAIESMTVYISTDTGYWIGDFISRHPDALVVLHGKETDMKSLLRRDYLGVRSITTFEDDQSARFGPRAKNGALFIGDVSCRYQPKKHLELEKE